MTPTPTYTTHNPQTARVQQPSQIQTFYHLATQDYKLIIYFTPTELAAKAAASASDDDDASDPIRSANDKTSHCPDETQSVFPPSPPPFTPAKQGHDNHRKHKHTPADRPSPLESDESLERGSRQSIYTEHKNSLDRDFGADQIEKRFLS
ncbi:hypothetical protein BDV95DRAFT_591085 [Massariosphaeria phaeospora]|uniref:Uncharacterized protein n=1 Tax=Massariosphaeria phaeospora TaxID=100035 RepID=A0A7C8MEC5_9PLEO|nr:hypothetical protein BDV95DRAFT_591085 [Massariosphaeria phaeospora]